MKRLGATRHFHLALAVAVVAALALAGTPAHAQATGTTSVSVSLNPLVILYYYTNVSVTFSGTDMTTIFGLPSSDAVATASAGTGTNTATSGQLAVTPGTALTLTPPTGYAANLVLLNNWAVRSIGLSGTGHSTQVAIAIGSSTLTNGTNGDQITIGTPATRVSGGGAFAATVQFAPTGLGNVQYGDVELPLTLDKATIGGAYSGGTYTLTASNI